MKNISRIIKISKPLRPLFLSILGLAFLSGIISQIVPILSKGAVDEIQKQLVDGGGDIDRLFLFVGLGFVVSIVSAAINSISQRLGDHYGGELRRFLIGKFYDHIFRLPQSYFDTEISGKIINQLNRGIKSVEEFMKAASNFIVPNIFTIILTIGLMFYYSWPVALFTILLFPIYTWLSYYSSKKWGEKEIPKNKHEDITRGRIQEVITNMKLVKGFSNQGNEYEFVDDQQEKVNDIYAEQSRTFHIFDFIRNFSLEIVLLGMTVVIFYNAFEGVYTFGTVVLLLQLIVQIRRPLFAMSFILTQIQTIESGTKEFFEIMDLKEIEEYGNKTSSALLRQGSVGHLLLEGEGKQAKENNDSDSVGQQAPSYAKASEDKLADLRETKNLTLQFDDVSFNYDNGGAVLNNVSLKINPNEKIALIGHSGAGKTTIVNLIMKFYEPTGGEILIGEKKYSELSHYDIRSQMSLVFQENELFSSTIRENVAYGQVGSETSVDQQALADLQTLQKKLDKKIIDALQQANAWEFVSKFEKGLDTEVGERGIRLSGGQKQRIQVARAILADTPIVILDEATSNLDAKSEKEVQEAMENLMKDKMVIIIAHRFSTIQNVDKIFVLDDGEVVDSGSPKELAKREGIYKQLLTYQLEGDRKLLEGFEIF